MRAYARASKARAGSASMPAGATTPTRAGCFRSSAVTATSARAEIGAIRIAANESYFQVSERATPGFIKALRRATIAPEDQGLVIEPAAATRDRARPTGRTSRTKSRGPRRNRDDRSQVRPRPSRAAHWPQASAPRPPRVPRQSSPADGSTR